MAEKEAQLSAAEAEAAEKLRAEMSNISGAQRAAVLMLLLAVQWYDSHQQMKALQNELARRSVEPVREAARDAQGRIEQIEARQHESQNQQAALEAM